MKRTVLCLLLFVAVPALADIGHDITIPIVGHVTLPDVTYRTELVIRNHRDVQLTIVFEFIGWDLSGDFFAYDGLLTLEPRGTVFDMQGRVPGGGDRVFALRMWAGKPNGRTDGRGRPLFDPDPEGRFEAVAHIISDRGRFAHKGSSRQEMPATASSEYLAPEATFYGVRHDGVAYTNVGITNMHETETVTYIIEFPYLAPFEVEVSPRSMRQVRIPGGGNAGRQVKITPEWATNGGTPKPWVAYASTVDPQTGDAYTGIRSLSKENYKGN